MVLVPERAGSPALRAALRAGHERRARAARPGTSHHHRPCPGRARRAHHHGPSVGGRLPRDRLAHHRSRGANLRPVDHRRPARGRASQLLHAPQRHRDRAAHSGRSLGRRRHHDCPARDDGMDGADLRGDPGGIRLWTRRRSEVVAPGSHRRDIRWLGRGWRARGEHRGDLCRHRGRHRALPGRRAGRRVGGAHGHGAVARVRRPRPASGRR